MKRLLRHGVVSVDRLVEELAVSAPSIRRDLTRLEVRGLVRRTHGGVTLVEPSLYELFRHDTSFQAQELRAADEKRRIGIAAADLVSEGEMIGLTAGTTTTQIGRALRHRHGISIVTNALNIGMELCNQTAIKTMMTGGRLAWQWTFAMAGQAAVDSVKTTHFDKVFLGVTGLDHSHGATTLELEEAFVSRAMLRRARKVIVVADSIKFGKVSASFICKMNKIHCVITDTGLSPRARSKFRALGITVITV